MNATSPSYRATGLRGCTSLALCTVVLSVWITSASAETILIDDFSDGNDAGWTRIDSNAGQAWGPGTFDASSGAYQLGTTGEVPVGAPGGGFLGSVWDQSSDPLFSNGFVRAKVRTDTAGSVASIVFRSSGDLATGFNGYLFHARTEEDGLGGFVFNRIEANEVADFRNVDTEFVFGVGEDWWIEAGGVGDQLSMKVWPVGDPEPESPQLTFTDSTFSTGQLGVEANIVVFLDLPFQNPARVNSTFDDIEFRAVPEPSAVTLACAGVAALLLRRRRTSGAYT